MVYVIGEKLGDSRNFIITPDNYSNFTEDEDTSFEILGKISSVQKDFFENNSLEISKGISSISSIYVKYYSRKNCPCICCYIIIVGNLIIENYIVDHLRNKNFTISECLSNSINISKMFDSTKKILIEIDDEFPKVIYEDVSFSYLKDSFYKERLEEIYMIGVRKYYTGV